MNIPEITADLDRFLGDSKDGTDTTLNDNSVDASTIGGLQAVQSFLHTEMIAVEGRILANEQNIERLQNVIEEVKGIIEKLEEVIANDFPEVREQLEGGIEDIAELIKLIEEIKKRAIEECGYDPLFFNEILEQMNFNKEETELLLQKLEEEYTSFGNHLQSLNELSTDLNDKIAIIEAQNSSLAVQMNEITSLMASIDQQMKESEEQKQVEELKKQEELAEQEEEEKKQEEEEERKPDVPDQEEEIEIIVEERK